MMHYLECIALLEFLQKKLCNGQRQQVPVSVVDEVQQSVVALQNRLSNERSSELTASFRDVMEAISVVKSTQGIIYLPDAMKTALNDGIDSLLHRLCLLAYDHFKYNEFEPTEQIIPIMRRVVKSALVEGVL